MEKQILKSSEVVDAMVEFVRQNLQLEDVKDPDTTTGSIIFQGRGIDNGNHFALEVITQVDKAVDYNFCEKRVSERSAPSKRDERIYTSLLFPKSIDYKKAKVEFICPYFKSPRLLDTADDQLKGMYEVFSYNKIKRLSRVEWQYAMSLLRSKIPYYNALKNIIQIHQFQRIGWNEIIPDKRPLDQEYFWDPVRKGHFPIIETTRKEEVFRGIEQGLHDKIRKIIRTEDINNFFTLESYGKGGARIITHKT